MAGDAGSIFAMIGLVMFVTGLIGAPFEWRNSNGQDAPFCSWVAGLGIYLVVMGCIMIGYQTVVDVHDLKQHILK